MHARCLVMIVLFTSATTVRGEDLTSEQQRQLKDAEYYLKQVERELPEISQTARTYSTSIAGVSQNDLLNALNKINWTGGKLNNVLTRLPELPPEHPEVVQLRNRVKELAATLLEAETQLNAAREKLAGVIDPARWPDLEHDLVELEGLSLMIANPDILTSDLEKANLVCQQLPQAIIYVNALRKKYAALLTQPVLPGRSFQVALAEFDQRLAVFREASKLQQAALPGLIQQDLDNAQAQANRAVAEKNARLFSGSVPQFLGWATEKLALLDTLSRDYPEPAQMARKNFETVTAAIAGMQQGLDQDIIAAHVPPADSYIGPDKKELTTLVTEAWKKTYPTDEIIGVRWTTKAWDRDTHWAWQGNKWYKVDASELRASVIVKTDDDIATVFYAYCVKDHLQGDAITVTEDDKTDVGVHRKMLISNVP